MEPEYKEINIVFENCNLITIKPKDILGFYIKGITESIWSNGTQYSKDKQCKFVSLVLKNSALKNETAFEYGRNSSSESFEYHLKNYHDITHIEVVLLDGTKEYVGVNWGKDDDQMNSLEKTVFEKDWFTIMIGK